MSSHFSTITASVVQISAAGALGSMLTSLSSRTVDPFASSYYTTKGYAMGVERDSHEEPIYADRKNIVRNRFELSRSFDLISTLVLVMDVPELDPDKMEYVHNLGVALIESATLSMGGHAISTISGGFLHCMEELGGKVGCPANVLYDTETAFDSTNVERHCKATRLYVPLSGFWFTKSLSTALNLVGSAFQRAYLDVTLRKLSDCVTVLTPGPITDAVKKNIPTEPMLGAFNPIDTDASNPGKLEGRVTLDSHGVTLNEGDREIASEINDMTLMTEVHEASFDLDKNRDIDLTTFSKNLNYEIILGCSTDNSTSPVDFDGGVDTVSLLISGQQRFPENMEASLYNKLMPFLHHSQIPQDKGILSLTLSMFPEDTSVPDSHINMSKLDTVTLRLTGNGSVRVFCLAYNILVQQRGMKARFFV